MLLDLLEVMKRPAASELTEKLEHSEARQPEVEFFPGNSTWKSAPAAIRKRMGVANLTAELCRQLSDLMQKL